MNVEERSLWLRATPGAALLAQTPVSKSWFLRLFRQYMGTTPYNFLLSTRITRAKELLVLTDFAVSEIAHQVGFGDESIFSTRFTAMVGQSPQQYRKSAMQPRRCMFSLLAAKERTRENCRCFDAADPRPGAARPLEPQRGRSRTGGAKKSSRHIF